MVLGKNATYEFAYGFPTLKSYYKLASNPWNLAYDPGGSSSGSGASVAAGLAYASMGSCTGGSIPLAGPVLRDRGTQGDLWTSEPCRHLSTGMEPGPCRTAGADGDRCGADVGSRPILGG